MIELIKEYLERTANPVQLVKHMDEVLEKNIKYPLMGQRKYDGIYALTIVCDGLHLFTRTGKQMYWEVECEIGDVLSQESVITLRDGVYITELCNDHCSLEVLAGLVSTNRKKAWSEEEQEIMYGNTYLMFHDVITIDELLGGKSDTSYRNRYSNLTNALQNARLLEYLVVSVDVFDREHADALGDSAIAVGQEGMVFKDPREGWIAGHKGYRAMKIVRGLHVDLLCVGVEYGKGKRTGQIAKLEFSYKGGVFSADLGKGWTDERRNCLTLAYQEDKGAGYDCKVHSTSLGEDFRNPVGQVWEVKALQESSTGKALRLPKVVRVREDKEIPDA